MSTTQQLTLSPLEIASDYVARGFSVVPIPFKSKIPTLKGWDSLRLTTADLSQHFNGRPMNVGVLLGDPSRGLVDVDLDCAEAIAVARRLLPSTKCKFGRRGNRSSHWLYRCGEAPATKQFDDPVRRKKDARLTELRSTGAQTVFPGSTHESGELVEFEEDDGPAEVDGVYLAARVASVAAAALLARHWPGEGSRHTAALALGSCLTRAGWAREDAIDFMQAVAEAAGDGEIQDRVRAVTDSFDRAEPDKKMTGWPTLAESLGEHGRAVTKRMRDWLGVKDTPAAPPPPQYQRPDLPTLSSIAHAGAANAVLIPGPHKTDAGAYLEIGNDEFASNVIGAMPAGELYRRGVAGELVTESGKKVFKPLGVDDVRLKVDRHMRLMKWVQKGKGDTAEQVRVFSPCTRDQGGIVLAKAATDPRVQEIRVLTSYPVFMPGFVLSPPGYHNGVFYDEPEELKGLRPETDREVVRQVLEDLVVDFPFRSEADRENYYGLLLTPLVRSAMEANAPMHLIMAPLERTGKTKLAEEVLGGIVLGHKAAAMQMPESDEEMDKRIIGALVKGHSILHLDNIREFIDSASLASLLTATVYSGRILGASKMLELPNNMTIVGTGNNVRATGEIVKRSIPINLQPATDAPEERKDFKHPDLWEYVKRSRRLVLECLLGMVQAWAAAGSPRGTVPMGGFDQWAATVGGVMQFFGFTKWMTNVKRWREEADPRRGDLRALVEEWRRVYPMGTVGVEQLVEIAARLELFPDVLAKLSAAGRPDRGVLTSFAMKVLTRNLNAPVGEWRIQRSTLGRPTQYYLSKAGGES